MTFYAIRPELVDSEDAEVIDQSKYGWKFLEQAITLWRLVDSERANKIEEIKDHAALAAGDGDVRFYLPELRELVALLDGVEQAIIDAGIVDHQWRVSPERLEELARKVPGMDLTTDRGLHAKTSALGEVMINAISLRNFLADAIKSGCMIVFN